MQPAEDRYLELLDASPAAMLIHRQGTITYANAAVAMLLGASDREHLLGREVSSILHPESREKVNRRIASMRGCSTPRQFDDELLVRLDGSTLAVRVTASEISFRGEAAIHVILSDVSEREQALDALRESEERYRTLVENAPEAIVVLDLAAGRFVDVNENAVRMFKSTRSGLLRLGPADLSPAVQPGGRASVELIKEYVEQALAGGKPVFEWTHRDTEGHSFPCEVRLVRLPSSQQALVRGSLTDISERQLLEAQLHQSQKLEAIGLLAGGVAHDFNNLLTVINGHAELAIEALDVPDRSEEDLRQVLAAGTKAATLARQLLTFGRREMAQPRVLDLHEVVANAGSMLSRLIEENIELEIRPEGSEARVEADPHQLEQVVINLVVNARDAIHDSGKVTLETFGMELEEKQRRGNLCAVPVGKWVVLRVSDTGAGIPDSVRERIFEPFFTTKPRAKGTGLGLSTVYGIVKQSGGHILVTSRSGRGSQFDVLLPRSDKELTDTRQAATTQSRGSETLLVVEDDDLVRRLAVKGLERCGYDVLEAPEGQQALAIAESRGEAIALVITDVIMPGMSGPELASRLRAQRPDARILFVSGYTDDTLQGVIGDDVRLLQKPFTPTSLAQEVRRILDG